MDFDEALRYLLSLGHETLVLKLGLTNTELLLEALGNPQLSFPSVQIAGTNGKGSTAVMLEGITRAAKIRTGLYTSPHLINITERIRISGQDISRKHFAFLTTRVRTCAQELLNDGALAALPTFFEQLTAIALLAFNEPPVELAILETGLGGRLDATTTAKADIVAITPIALDHQEHLGPTLSEIAAEKAAIIRPGVTAIVGSQSPEALDVILKRCAESAVVPRVAECMAETLTADNTGRVHGTFVTTQDRYENVRLGLRGRHQATNAVIAIAVAEALRDRGFPITSQDIREGLETAEHPGRLDLRARRPWILYDGAHNHAGAVALRNFLDEFIKSPITLVFGAMREKDLAGIASALFPVAKHLILTLPSNPRAATLETLSQLVPDGFDSSRITLAATAEDALNAARVATPENGIICVTGSLYLIGEVLSLFSEQTPGY